MWLCNVFCALNIELGLEIFDVRHPMEHGAHASALWAHAQGQQPDGLAAAGREALGLWVPGFAADELTQGVSCRPQCDVLSSTALHCVAHVKN